MNKQSKVFSIFIIVLILNIISNYLNFKIDLTEDKKYTLSENSKEILLNVDDIISVKVYLNGELPSGFQMLKTSIKNFLTNISNQNKLIEFEFIDPNDEDKNKREEIYKQLQDQGLYPTDLTIKKNNETSRKIMDLSIEFNVPIGFGILTCYDLEQAIIRSDINQKNKGQEAALDCIELLK